MTFSSTILLTAHEDFTEGIKYLDLIREVLFSSSIEPGKMNRLRRKTIKVLFYVDLSYITALYFSSLYVGNMDDQCRGPSIKEKDHLVGSLTSGFKTGMVGTQSREARPAPAQGKSCPGLLRPQNFFFCPPRNTKMAAPCIPDPEHTIYLYVVDKTGELRMYLGRAPCVGWWSWGPVP